MYSLPVVEDADSTMTVHDFNAIWTDRAHSSWVGNGEMVRRSGADVQRASWNRLVPEGKNLARASRLTT